MSEFKRILVAVDRSDISDNVLKRAFLFAKQKKAQLVVLHVVKTSIVESIFEEKMGDDEIRSGFMTKIDKINREICADYVLLVEHGDIVDSVMSKVHRLNIDMLIIGSHGKEDITSNHFGSTALKLIEKTHKPVLVVKNSVKGEYKSVIAPTNLSDYSKESIAFANTLFCGVDWKYIYAYDSISEFYIGAYRISEALLKEASKKAKIAAKNDLDKFSEDLNKGEQKLVEFKTSINEDLLEYIENDDADLLVLGSKELRGLSSFVFGSVASYLLKKTTLDTLVYVPVVKKKEDNKKDKKSDMSAIDKDLENRIDDIREDLKVAFKRNVKIANWNIPEANDQEIAQKIVAILQEELDVIKEDIKNGKYQQERVDSGM